MIHKKSGQCNTSIVAAAFQDHITQRFNVLSTFDDNLTKMKRSVINKKPIGKSVVATRSQRVNHKPRKEDYVLNENKNYETLAESLGLVGSPNIIINDAVWQKQKNFSISRGDFALPCSICQEDFKLIPTVLLSCSHIFHRNCIESFEKYSNKKSCPICRTINYQKMVVFQQETIYKSKCATKIQAIWRGYKQRKWYKEYYENHAPKSSILNKKWLEEKVHKMTNRYLNAVKEVNIDHFISDLDDTVHKSQKVYEEWDQMQSTRKNNVSDKWVVILEKSIKWQQSECTICLQNWSKCRNRVILSCSHILHKICLLTFESVRARDKEKYKICPLCREVYDRRDIHSTEYIYA